jgi:hypothetical protein
MHYAVIFSNMEVCVPSVEHEIGAVEYKFVLDECLYM